MEDGGEASSSSSEVRSVSSHVDVPRIPNPQLKKLLFFKVYKRRWFVLLVLCLLNCSNATVSWQQVSDRWWVHVKFEMQLVFHRCFLSKFESVWFKSSIPGSFTGKQTIFFMVKTKNNNNIVYLRGKKKNKGNRLSAIRDQSGVRSILLAAASYNLDEGCKSIKIFNHN